MKKTVCISIPCYNEVDNVEPLCERILEIFEVELKRYDCIIQLIDNCSVDGTRDVIRKLCDEHKQIRAIFNVKNFPRGSAFHGLMVAEGACTIFMPCDFQGPPELIPKFIEKWEQGFKIVCGVKNKSKESPIIFAVRKLYYKLISMSAKLENIEYIDQFTGFGLYDKEFMDFVRQLGDPMPFMRSLVAEYGYKIGFVNFEQPKRKFGKSKVHFYDLYDSAMRSFTMNTKIGIRMAAFMGASVAFVSAVSFILFYIINLKKNKYSNMIFHSEIAFWGGCILTFIGVLGEYILSINTRVMRHPFFIEECRINFPENNHEGN